MQRGRINDANNDNLIMTSDRQENDNDDSSKKLSESSNPPHSLSSWLLIEPNRTWNNQASPHQCYELAHVPTIHCC